MCKNQSAVPKLGDSTGSCLIYVVVDAVGCFFVLFVLQEEEAFSRDTVWLPL